MIRRVRRMYNFSAKPTSCKSSLVTDGTKENDPLVVRKKFEISDTFYRKSSPERALMKTEFSSDTEISVALLACIGAAAVLMCTVHCIRKRRRISEYERAKYKIKHET